MIGANTIYRAGALLLVLVLCLGPSGYLLGLSESGAGVGADGAYAHTVSSYAVLLWNTLVVASGTTAFALILAMPLSFALMRMRIPLRRTCGAIVLGCAVLPLHIYVAAWVGALGIQAAPGVFSKLAVGGVSRTLWDAVVVGGLAKVPLAALLMSLSLWGIRPETEEAAWLDTSRMGVFRHVIVRHVAGSLLFAGSVLFGLCLGEIAVTDILSIRTLAEEAYVLFQLTLDPRVVITTGSLVFTPILVPWLVLVCVRTFGHLAADEAHYAGESAVFRNIPRLTNRLVSLFVVVAVVCIAGIPFITFARLLSRYGGFFRCAWDLSGEYALSVLVGGIAAIMSSLLAFLLVLICQGTKWWGWIAGIALCGLMVPGATTGIALVKLFNHPGIAGMIYSSPAIIAIGQFLRYFPLCLLILGVFMRAVPRQYEQMAVVDGARMRDVIGKVYFPICIRPLAVTTVITFLWCLGDLDTSLIVCPPGRTTLPIRMFTMLHYGVYGEVATACVMLVVTIIACLVLVVGILGREYMHVSPPRV